MRLFANILWLWFALFLTVPDAFARPAVAPTTARLVLRAREQALYVYGARGGQPVVLSSGDGGWTHLAPHVAEALADRGFFVVGFDTRAYLSGFTSAQSGLQVGDEPADYKALVEFATIGSAKKPILIGVSEGAGLSVLAATDPAVKAVIAGVIGLGLPERNELAWHWKDAIIYMTHRVPNEPLFSARAIAGKVSPIPLAVIDSSHDAFVTLRDMREIIDAAAEPKKLWVIEAADHAFTDNRQDFDQHFFEAVAWVTDHAPR